MTTANKITNKPARKLPKDKFYRRYAAAYVLGIPADNVPEYTWKELFPRVYEADDDGVTLENFRNVKAQIKGLSGANVISMVRAAQAGKELPEPTKPVMPPAQEAKTNTGSTPVSEWVEVEHENMPNPPAKAPAPKKAAKPRKAKRSATSDADAINKLYGSQS
tara:strand:- start:4923 stop:5411 length:489 start_codon:yes stop_codon:yes gene_type:complete